MTLTPSRLQVSGLPTPDLIWQLNGQTIRPDSAHKMLVRENGVHSLVIEPVTSRDAGIYTCIASNRAGQNSFNLELIVAGRCGERVAGFERTRVGHALLLLPRSQGDAQGADVHRETAEHQRGRGSPRAAGVPRLGGSLPPNLLEKGERVPHPKHRPNQVDVRRRAAFFTPCCDSNGPMSVLFPSMHQDNCGYLCMIIQPALKEDAGWYTVSAKNEAGIVSSTARLDVHGESTHTQTSILVRTFLDIIHPSS